MIGQSCPLAYGRECPYLTSGRTSPLAVDRAVPSSWTGLSTPENPPEHQQRTTQPKTTNTPSPTPTVTTDPPARTPPFFPPCRSREAPPLPSI